MSHDLEDGGLGEVHLRPVGLHGPPVARDPADLGVHLLLDVGEGGHVQGEPLHKGRHRVCA